MRSQFDHRRLAALVAALCALSLCPAAALAQVPPANDNFADAEVLATDGTWLGSNIGATAESGEPANAGVPSGASVWFRWTAPGDGFVTFDTYGSDYDTTLGLYTGPAVNALDTVASNDDSLGLLSELPFIPVTSGTVYHLSVDGYTAATGQITLNWSYLDGNDTTPPLVNIIVPADGSTFVENSSVAAIYACEDEFLGSGVASCVGEVPNGDPIDTAGIGPHTFTVTGIDNDGNTNVVVSSYTVIEALANDAYANAEPLATDGTWLGTNTGASLETGEMTNAGVPGGASVWFRWTAPDDGFLTVDTIGSDFDTTLGVYTGIAVDALTSIASNDDAVGLQSRVSNEPVTSGSVYSISVDGYFGGTGQITLNWSYWDGTDTTPPVVTIATPVEGANYVENAIVPADYACADEELGSGVATCIGDVPVGVSIDTAAPGAHVFTVTGTDTAGNAGVGTVNYTVGGLDSTLPTANIVSPLDGAIYSQGGAITADYTCADETFGTGIASCIGDVAQGQAIDTSVLGPHTFTVTATDNAGNVAAAVSSYTIIEALANDNFAGALSLAPDGTLINTNVGATKETGEPAHAGNQGGASVWFQWTAAITGYITVDTFGSNFNTLLGLYTGSSVDALTTIASNDNTSGAQSKLTNVAVTGGTTYYIAVDGSFGATGTITLNWSFAEQFDTVPPNVTIWDPIDGLTLPQGAVENSAYSCFDPFPSSGMASCVGDVPTGDPIDTSTPGEFTFTATGTDVAGNVTVATATYTVVGNPDNDDFADATALALEGTLAGSNAGATKEPGEPNHGGNVGGTSVWFHWTAPVDGFITVDTFGSDFDTILGLYTGTSVDALTEIASNVDAGGGVQSQLLNVRVNAGTTYSIALTGWIYTTGNYTLTWSFLELNDLTAPEVTIRTPADGAIFFEGVTVLADYQCIDEYLGAGLASCVGDIDAGMLIDTALAGNYSFTVTGTDNAGNFTTVTTNYSVQPLTNDDFANALPLAGEGGLIGSNVGATKETGEPDHAGNPGGASVWFKWTATEDIFFSVDTLGSDFDTTLAIYTGTSLADLTELASSNNTTYEFQSEIVDLFVTAGETYYIAVDGVGGATGQIDLDWSVFDGPAFVEITPPADPLWVTDADHDFWLNAAAPADVDGDGDLDLAAIGFFVEYNVSAEDRLVVFMNEGPDVDGNWQFTTQDVPLVDQYAGASDLAWGDYDNDGDPDLAVASEGVTALYRNDAGTLVLVPTVLPGYWEDSGYTGAYDLRSITWADYDNDSDLDLLIPSVYDPDNFEFRTALMRNDGDDGQGGWTFTEVATTLDATVHAQTAWADNDGDGDLDLFMANVGDFFLDGFVRTYRNDGDGVFEGAEPIGNLVIDYGLGDWSDYDGDGDLDILVVGLVLDTDGNYKTILRIYDNEAGTLVPNTLVQSSFFPWLDLHAATWADYDNDGDVDILLTGQVIGPVELEGKSVVYVNDDGVFTPLQRALPAPIGTIGRGGSFTWFDVDGDGDLDYFVAGAYYVPNGNNLVEAMMHLYRNDVLVPNNAPLPPASLAAVVNGDTVELSWDAAADDATATAALTYQLEVRPQSVVRDAMAVRQRLPEPGNISAATSWTLRGLAPGIYTWMVQAVDSAFNGSVAAEASFTIGDLTDSDGDGVPDGADNCLGFYNPLQRDTDGDGYGNRCDPDFNNDGIVNFVDLAQLSAVFFTSDANADLNGDGIVNFLDSQIMSDFFFLPPGPSGTKP